MKVFPHSSIPQLNIEKKIFTIPNNDLFTKLQKLNTSPRYSNIRNLFIESNKRFETYQNIFIAILNSDITNYEKFSGDDFNQYDKTLQSNILRLLKVFFLSLDREKKIKYGLNVITNLETWLREQKNKVIADEYEEEQNIIQGRHLLNLPLQREGYDDPDEEDLPNNLIWGDDRPFQYENIDSQPNLDNYNPLDDYDHEQILGEFSGGSNQNLFNSEFQRLSNLDTQVIIPNWGSLLELYLEYLYNLKEKFSLDKLQLNVKKINTRRISDKREYEYFEFVDNNLNTYLSNDDANDWHKSIYFRCNDLYINSTIDIITTISVIENGEERDGIGVLPIELKKGTRIKYHNYVAEHKLILGSIDLFEGDKAYFYIPSEYLSIQIISHISGNSSTKHYVFINLEDKFLGTPEFFLKYPYALINSVNSDISVSNIFGIDSILKTITKQNILDKIIKSGLLLERQTTPDITPLTNFCIKEKERNQEGLKFDLPNQSPQTTYWYCSSSTDMRVSGLIPHWTEELLIRTQYIDRIELVDDYLLRKIPKWFYNSLYLDYLCRDNMSQVKINEIFVNNKAQRLISKEFFYWQSLCKNLNLTDNDLLHLKHIASRILPIYKLSEIDSLDASQICQELSKYTKLWNKHTDKKLIKHAKSAKESVKLKKEKYGKDDPSVRGYCQNYNQPVTGRIDNPELNTLINKIGRNLNEEEYTEDEKNAIMGIPVQAGGLFNFFIQSGGGLTQEFNDLLTKDGDITQEELDTIHGEKDFGTIYPKIKNIVKRFTSDLFNEIPSNKFFIMVKPDNNSFCFSTDIEDINQKVLCQWNLREGYTEDTSGYNFDVDPQAKLYPFSISGYDRIYLKYKDYKLLVSIINKNKHVSNKLLVIYLGNNEKVRVGNCRGTRGVSEAHAQDSNIKEVYSIVYNKFITRDLTIINKKWKGHINIQLPNGETINIPVKSTNSISEIKDKIKESTKLIYFDLFKGDTKLLPITNISQNDITNNETITLKISSSKEDDIKARLREIALRDQELENELEHINSICEEETDIEECIKDRGSDELYQKYLEQNKLRSERRKLTLELHPHLKR